MVDFLRSWYRTLKRLWVQFGEQATSLWEALWQRLSPVVEQLRPIWQDPLWQAIALVVFLVLAALLGLWLIGKMQGLTISLVELVVKGFKKLFSGLMLPLRWLSAGIKALLDKSQIKKAFGQRILAAQARRAADAIQYLTTQREWRYQLPWSFVVGEVGSGKSQILSSVTKGRRANLLPKEKRIRGENSGWHFFDHGVIIEPGPGKFSAVLEQLHWYRPERPLDNVILCISAKTLLNKGSPAVLEELGEQLFQQLWQTQKKTGFVLPVYLFVTRCDEIEGFEAFWGTQQPEIREQMIGWSNPYRLDVAFDLDWINQAFEQLLDSLRNLQLSVAAGGQEITDIDRFMLFLHQFSQLQEPLTHVLKSAFTRSSLQEALPIRSICFCGQMDGKTAFVEDAFQRKIFAEKNLSTVLEKRRFSSNKLLRRFQTGTIAAAILLTLTLVYDIVRLNNFNEFAEKEFKQLALLKKDCTPQGLDTYKLLRGLSEIGGQARLISMPVSWFDFKAREDQLHVAEHLLNGTFFEGLECRLKLRADALTVASQSAINTDRYPRLLRQFEDFREQLLAFEENQQNFISLAGPLENNRGISKKLRDLLNYLYDNPVPKDINLQASLILGSIRVSDFSAGWMENTATLISRKKSERHLDELSQRLQLALLQHAQDIPIEGIQTFNAGIQRTPDNLTLLPSVITEDYLNFSQWVQQTHHDWLATMPESSPCGILAEQIEIMAQDLVRYGYDSERLRRIDERFLQEQCDKVVRTGLAEINVAPFGTMYRLDERGLLSQSESLNTLLATLKTIHQQSFVKESFPPVVDSSEAIVVWQEAPLQQLLDILVDFQQFMQQDNPSRLFDSALRLRVQQVTERLLSESMVRPSQQIAAPKPINDLIAWQERTVNTGVISFKQVREQLLQIQALLQQQEDNANALWLTQQIQGFIGQQLRLLEKLVKEYHLYQPVNNPQWQKNDFTQAMFNLTDDKKTQAYLIHQRQQISYFAFNYAQPLLQYLQNSETGLSDALVQRWLATLQDLARFDRGEPNNQVSLLDDLIAVKLTQITDQQCPDQGHFDVAHENAGWFAKRRAQIENQVNLHCATADKQAVIARYMQVSDLFNTTVAGYFPFAEVDKAGIKDLKPKLLQDFLTRYGELSKDLLSDLNTLMQKDDSIPESWRQFMLKMDAINLFFASTWQDKTKQWLVDVDVQFDALEDQAKGSNQVIEWGLSSGLTRAQFPNGERQIQWSPGDKLQLDLRWAKGSAYLPLGLPDNSRKNVQFVTREKLMASFQTRSQWGIFEWLNLYSLEELSLNEEQHLLSFYVPVAVKGETAHMEAPAYVSRSNLVLKAVVPDEKGELQPLAVPNHFPVYAPGLNE